MNSKEIKVNNQEELIAKIKELVAEDSSWKLVEEYWVSRTLSYEPNGSEKVIKKPRQGVKLAKKVQELDIYCEAENPFNASSGIDERMKNYLKMSNEVNKIIERVSKNDFPSRPIEPAPYTPPTPPNPISDKKDSGKVFWSSRYVGCPSLERAKELIKEYYQEHQKEIQENAEFSRWIKVESREREREREAFPCLCRGPQKIPSWPSRLTERTAW